jgi:hypothetical protein
LEQLEVLPDALKGCWPLGPQLVEGLSCQVLSCVPLCSFRGNGLEEAVGPFLAEGFRECQEPLGLGGARDELQVAKSLGPGGAVVGGRSK